MSEDEDINVIIDFTHRTSLIRFLGDAMLPVRVRLRTDVFASETAKEIDFDITFAKIRFWFESVVSRSVVFARSNTNAASILMSEAGRPRVANNLMITPFEPTDEHLAVLFQSKMGALSGGTVEFGNVRVEPDDAGLVFTYVGDWHDDLPEMKDWFNAKPYYFEQPWWCRDDASTLDVIAHGADPRERPGWAYSLDFIEQAIRPKAEKGKKKDEVVIRGAFRPKIITGGRTTDE
jgi:hypothetical protein